MREYKKRDTWQVSRTVSVTFLRQLSVCPTAVRNCGLKKKKNCVRHLDPEVPYRKHTKISSQGRITPSFNSFTSLSFQLDISPVCGKLSDFHQRGNSRRLCVRERSHVRTCVLACASERQWNIPAISWARKSPSCQPVITHDSNYLRVIDIPDLRKRHCERVRTRIWARTHSPPN